MSEDFPFKGEVLGSIGYKNCYKCTKYQYYRKLKYSCKLIFKFSLKVP